MEIHRNHKPISGMGKSVLVGMAADPNRKEENGKSAPMDVLGNESKSNFGKIRTGPTLLNNGGVVEA